MSEIKTILYSAADVSEIRESEEDVYAISREELAALLEALSHMTNTIREQHRRLAQIEPMLRRIQRSQRIVRGGGVR